MGHRCTKDAFRRARRPFSTLLERPVAEEPFRLLRMGGFVAHHVFELDHQSLGVCQLTYAISPISLSLKQLRPYSPVRRAAWGKRRWTGAPLFAARIGHGVVAKITFAQHSLGGAPVLTPCREDLKVLTPPDQQKENLIFWRTCADWCDMRTMRVPQHRKHCAKITELLLCWMESQPCVRCERDIRMVELLGEGCHR